MRRLAESMLRRAATHAQPEALLTEAVMWGSKAVENCEMDKRDEIKASYDYVRRKQAQFYSEKHNNYAESLIWARYLFTGTGGYIQNSITDKIEHWQKALTLASTAHQNGLNDGLLLATEIQAALQILIKEQYHHNPSTPNTYTKQRKNQL